MKLTTLAFLAMLCACEDDPIGKPSDVPDATVAIEDTEELPPGADAGADASVAADPVVADASVAAPLTEQEAREKAFGATGWECCWTTLCDALCGSDEVPTVSPVNTASLVCQGDIGQCPESSRTDPDADAGL